MLRALTAALAPLAGSRESPSVGLRRDGQGDGRSPSRRSAATRRAASPNSTQDDAGEKLAEFLRGLAGATAGFDFAPAEWPDVMAALIGPEMVKPSQGAERRIAIWGALEARLQSVDTLVIGGLNEGSWPRRAEADRFMSRLMKSGLDLEPPERRIGQAAHDFVMAIGRETRDPDALGPRGRSAGRAVALAAAAD